MEYSISGKGDKVVLFLHGWGGGFDNFASAISAIEQQCLCVNFSFHSATETRALILDDYVKFVNDTLNQIKLSNSITTIIAVGHSFGGRIALRLGAMRIVDSIVLIDSAGLKPRRNARYYFRRIKGVIAKKLNLKIAVGSPDYRQLSPIGKKTFSNIVSTYQDSECRHIHIPTLIIWGAQDKETPIYMARRLNRLIESSALIIFSTAEHYAYLDDYPRFISILKSFIADS